jgi:hypothetical protein
MSAEHIVDGLIRYIQKNIVARQLITEEAPAGSNVLKVDNSIHFNDVDEVALAINGSSDVHFNTILKVADTNSIILLNPTVRDYGPGNGAVIQKAIGNSPLYEDKVLFGDRNVIPISDGVAVTIEPATLDNEWVGLPGLLSEEYAVVIMIYVKGDDHQRALRVAIKYSDAIYKLLNSKIHMDLVNDEVPITTNLSSGDTIISIPTTDGWPVDNRYIYEVQNNAHVEIDFSIEEVVSPTQLRINRPLLYNYDMTDKLKFIRRVKYIYDSRVRNVEYGTVSKESSLYKAARLSWFGKESEDYIFPQHSKS